MRSHRPQFQTTPKGASPGASSNRFLLLPSAKAVLTHRGPDEDNEPGNARCSGKGRSRVGPGLAQLSPGWFVGFWKRLKCRQPGAGSHGRANQLPWEPGRSWARGRLFPSPRTLHTPGVNMERSPAANVPRNCRDMGMALPRGSPQLSPSTAPS